MVTEARWAKPNMVAEVVVWPLLLVALMVFPLWLARGARILQTTGLEPLGWVLSLLGAVSIVVQAIQRHNSRCRLNYLVITARNPQPAGAA